MLLGTRFIRKYVTRHCGSVKLRCGLASRSFDFSSISNLFTNPAWCFAFTFVAINQSRLGGVEDRVTEVRKQYAREYRERRRLFNIVQVWRGRIVTAPSKVY